jgi:hypothetical protein
MSVENHHKPITPIGYPAYVAQRRAELLEAVEELSPESRKDWEDAARRLVKKLQDRTHISRPMSVESALEILVTIYATDDNCPCQNLPKGD